MKPVSLSAASVAYMRAMPKLTSASATNAVRA